MGLSIPSTDNYHISDYTRAKESNNVTDKTISYTQMETTQRKKDVCSLISNTLLHDTQKHQNRQMKLKDPPGPHTHGPKTSLCVSLASF